MGNVRFERESDKVVLLTRSLFLDDNISLEAKGLYGLLCSLPQDEPTYIEDIQNLCSNSMESIRLAEQELRDLEIIG